MISGEPGWQELPAAGHLISVAKSREKRTHMLANLLAYLHSARFFCSYTIQGPAHKMVSPTFRLGFPASINSGQSQVESPSYRLSSQVTLGCVNLTKSYTYTKMHIYIHEHLHRLQYTQRASYLHITYTHLPIYIQSLDCL